MFGSKRAGVRRSRSDSRGVGGVAVRAKRAGASKGFDEDGCGEEGVDVVDVGA
jgi:hypothetical protein